ncbi:MAG: hypothetical protein ACR2FO_03535 [Actinomycetota bacterium]
MLAPPINGHLIELVHSQLKQVGIQMESLTREPQDTNPATGSVHHQSNKDRT